MIKAFSIRPKPQNNNAKITFAVLLSVSAVCFAVSYFMELYKGIVSTVGLFVLVTAVLIYTKFISPAFYYDICFDSEQTPIFVVRQLIGKRFTTLCRVDLADIKKIEGEDREGMKSHATPSGYKKYVYAPTLRPSFVYRLTVINKYEKAEIILELSEDHASLLSEYSKEAKALCIEDDEE